MQCVILAGGLGTRMRPLTDHCPKALLPAHGRPFAWHQLQWLVRHGVTEVVYSIGHKGWMIRRYCEAEAPAGLSIRYVDEGERELGTGGALRLALDAGALRESFFVLYGDSYLPIEFRPVWEAFRTSRLAALMTVLRNEGRWDTSNVIFEDGRVRLYDKQADAFTRSGMQYIDYGLSALRRDVIETIPAGHRYDLATLLKQLSLGGRLAGYETRERFYEIGSPAGLADFEAYLDRQAATPSHEPEPLLEARSGRG